MKIMFVNTVYAFIFPFFPKFVKNSVPAQKMAYGPEPDQNSISNSTEMSLCFSDGILVQVFQNMSICAINNTKKEKFSSGSYVPNLRFLQLRNLIFYFFIVQNSMKLGLSYKPENKVGAQLEKFLFCSGPFFG